MVRFELPNIKTAIPPLENLSGGGLNSDIGKKIINIKFENAKFTQETIGKDQFKKILETYGEDNSRKSRKNIESLEYDNEKKALIINYKNSSKKTINQDKSYETISSAINPETGENDELIRSYTSQKLLTKEKIISKDKTLETYFDQFNHKQKSVEVTKNGQLTTIYFDESEQPITKKVQSGTTVLNYDFNGKNSTERITSKIMNQGLPIETTENYTYTDDGHVEIASYSASCSQGTSESNNSTGLNNGISSNVSYCSCSMDNFDSSNGNVKDRSLLQPASVPVDNQTKSSDPGQNERMPESNSGHPESSTATDSTPENAPAEPKSGEAPSGTPVDKPKSEEQNDNSYHKPEHVGTTTSLPANEPKPQQIPADQPVNNQKPAGYNGNPTELPKPRNLSDVNSAIPNRPANPTNGKPVLAKPGDSAEGRRVSGNGDTLTNVLGTSINTVNNQVHPPRSITTRQNYLGTGNTEALLAYTSQELGSNIHIISKQIDNYIKQYAAEKNISEDSVRKMLGISANISIEKFLNNTAIQNLSAENATLITNIINELKVTLYKEVKDIDSIKNEITQLLNITKSASIIDKNLSGPDNNTVTDSVKANNEYINVSDRTLISDINQYSSENGIKANDLISQINSIGPGNSTITKLNVQINGEIVEKTFRIEVPEQGEIYITEVAKKSKENPVLQKVISEIVPYIQPEYKNELLECSSIEKCKIMLIEYSAKKSNYTVEESVHPDVKDSDLQYRHVFYNGSFYKVPAGQTLPDEVSTVEEIYLNVTADKQMFEEIDTLISKGTYKNKDGKTIKVPAQNVVVRTAKSGQEWASSEEPVVFEFSEPVNKKLEQAILEISQKYKRKSESENHTENNSHQIKMLSVTNGEEVKKIQNILISIGIPNAQQTAIIASMMYSSYDGFRKLVRNNNEKFEITTSAVTMNNYID